MNTRPLDDDETRILEAFRQAANDFSLVYLTETTLKKSIIDATIPVRTMLREAGLHDFSQQGQGTEHKRNIAITFLDRDGESNLSLSLYRPNTKQGDPRIWFSGLTSRARAGDVLVFFLSDDALFLGNITALARAGYDPRDGSKWLTGWLGHQRSALSRVADELLNRLVAIVNRGPLKAVCSGDTAVGRTLETALGIAINSSKAPDFKGIEIKSHRKHAKRENRQTLFAQVPDWKISSLKSSAEILDAFGYERDGVRKLYCEVSTRVWNSQGLRFRLAISPDRLIEYSKNQGDVVCWSLEKLHARLLEKHRETFWVETKSAFEEGHEFFKLVSVTHSRAPSTASFDNLLETGFITMDHLVSRKSGKVCEKGPLFKIEKSALPDLFLSQPIKHMLGG